MKTLFEQDEWVIKQGVITGKAFVYHWCQGPSITHNPPSRGLSATPTDYSLDKQHVSGDIIEMGIKGIGCLACKKPIPEHVLTIQVLFNAGGNHAWRNH